LLNCEATLISCYGGAIAAGLHEPMVGEIIYRAILQWRPPLNLVLGSFIPIGEMERFTDCWN